MLEVWILITLITICVILAGQKLQSLGYNTIGTVLMLVGIFQLVGECIAIF